MVHIFYITIITLLVAGLGLLYKKAASHKAFIGVQEERIGWINNQLETKALQSKLNPHFLFNSLNAIQFFVSEGNKKATLQYINRFSMFLRTVLRNTDSGSITAREEAEVLEQYLWLEQNRFPGKFTYSIDYSTSFENDNIPPLISIGMAEHVLYRSILNVQNSDPKNLAIRLAADGEFLMINITDNGTPLKASEKYSDDLSKRMALINHKKAQSAVMNYHSENDTNISILQITQPNLHH